MQALLIRLAAYTAHFRDPRINTAKIGLPARTLHCPPPCTVHGLLCSACGGWVDTASLSLGWRIDCIGMAIDFQTSRLPQRKEYNSTLGAQKIAISPVEREFLTFPVLTILALGGVKAEWIRRPANPLSLGRSEDLIVEKFVQQYSVSTVRSGEIQRQCLPIGVGAGTIYTAPLYFESNRKPIGMTPKTDAVQKQTIHSAEIARVEATGETFYVWKFGQAAREKWSASHLP